MSIFVGSTRAQSLSLVESLLRNFVCVETLWKTMVCVCQERLWCQAYGNKLFNYFTRKLGLLCALIIHYPTIQLPKLWGCIKGIISYFFFCNKPHLALVFSLSIIGHKPNVCKKYGYIVICGETPYII